MTIEEKEKRMSKLPYGKEYRKLYFDVLMKDVFVNYICILATKGKLKSMDIKGLKAIVKSTEDKELIKSINNKINILKGNKTVTK